MDLVTTGMVQSQSGSDKLQEQAAMPNGKGSVTNLVDRLDSRFGLGLSEDAKGMAEQAVHYGRASVPARCTPCCGIGCHSVLGVSTDTVLDLLGA